VLSTAVVSASGEPTLTIGIAGACSLVNNDMIVQFFYNNTGDTTIALFSGTQSNFVTFGKGCLTRYSSMPECWTPQPQPSLFRPGYHIAFSAKIACNGCTDAWVVQHGNAAQILAMVPDISTLRGPCFHSVSLGEVVGDIKKKIWG
jgi:hypothetical protein